MYSPFQPGDSLCQGDVCRDVPLPLLTDTALLADTKAQQMLGGGPPTKEVLATRSTLVVAVPLQRTHVMILSQSCDAEDAERKGGRILVAPVLSDDHERFLASFEGATKDAGDSFMKKLATTAAKGGSTPAAAMDKGKSSLENPRRNALKKLWLGDSIGAFPLAADEGAGLGRSICYFDNIVSLPASWIPLLRERRVLRLTVEWASVLQEAAATWIGRFAFPGSNEDRLRVGGLANDAEKPAEAVSLPSTATQGSAT